MGSEELQRARIDAGPGRLSRLETQAQINHTPPAQGCNLPAPGPVAAWGHEEGVGTQCGMEPPASPNEPCEIQQNLSFPPSVSCSRNHWEELHKLAFWCWQRTKVLCCRSEGSVDGTEAHGALEAVGNTDQWVFRAGKNPPPF